MNPLTPAADDQPDGSKLIASARSLRSYLVEATAEIDRTRRLPETVIEKLKDAGIFNALIPKTCGGAEVQFETFFDTLVELGRANGSVAWTCAVLGTGAWMAATFYPEETSREMFRSDNPLTSAVLVPKTIVARRVDGGLYIEQGQWTFNSGVHHAGWNIVGIPVFGEGGRPIDLVSALVRKADLTVLDDWHSLGLKGSGSCTVAVEHLFVPDTRLVSHNKIMVEEYPSKRTSDAALYHMPVLPTVMISMIAPVIGIARGALEKFVDISKKRHIAMTFYHHQCEAAVTHLQIAEASAKIDAADMVLRRSILELEQSASKGESLINERKARMWRDVGFAGQLIWQAVDLLANASGGSFARDGNPVGEAWRDIRTALSHAGLTTSTSFETYGRVAYGLPSNSPMLP